MMMVMSGVVGGGWCVGGVFGIVENRRVDVCRSAD
jgi:hypothetical protein